MTENQSEPQLADQARTALLEAITRAAEAGHGETAEALAKAYDIVNKSAPSSMEEPPGAYQYADNRLDGRR